MASDARCGLAVWAVVAACLQLCLPDTVPAAPSFAHVFRIDSTELPVSGSMSADADSAFLSFSLSPPGGPDGLVQSMGTGAYFSETGELLWSLRPAPPLEVLGSQPPPPDPGLFPVQVWAVLSPGEDASKVHVTYGSGTGLHRFGIVDAASLAPVYAYETRYAPPDETLFSFPWINDARILLRSGSESISFLLMDAGGAAVFDWMYTSPAFLDNEGAGGLLQFAGVWPFSEDSYYLIGHAGPGLVEINPGGPPPPYKCVITRLDAGGNVMWARALERSTPEPAGDVGPDLCISLVLPDGSIVFVLGDSSFDLSVPTSRHRAHLVKIQPDGSLGWAQTLEDALVFIGSFPDDASYIYVAGAASSPGSSSLLPSSGLLARIDTATGTVTHEFRLPPEENAATLAVYATSDRHIYAGRLVRGNDQALIPAIIRLERDLANPAGFRQPEGRLYSGSGAFMDGRLLVSEFDPAAGELRAFNVNEDLQALEPACTAISFTPFPVTQAEPALTVSPFSVTLEAIDVNAAPAGTELVPAALPVMPISLDIKECAAAPLTAP
jgi:hypothetical protein